MPRPNAAAMTFPDFSGLTFLVVEDDRDSRGFLGELLRARGAIVVEADSVRAAKAFAGTMKLDMIVTDLAMPAEDGAMLLKWLREQPRDRGGAVPTVAVTAFYEQYEPDQVSGWAAQTFRKPLKIDNFVQAIAAILNLPGAELPKH